MSLAPSNIRAHPPPIASEPRSNTSERQKASSAVGCSEELDFSSTSALLTFVIHSLRIRSSLLTSVLNSFRVTPSCSRRRFVSSHIIGLPRLSSTHTCLVAANARGVLFSLRATRIKTSCGAGSNSKGIH